MIEIVTTIFSNKNNLFNKLRIEDFSFTRGVLADIPATPNMKGKIRPNDLEISLEKR
jgi:hypothetical protein